MNLQFSANNMQMEIEREYQKFLDRLDLLKREQEKLIKEYEEKLKQRKLSQLKKQLGIKNDL